jgi:hypothetical protein
VLLCDNQQVALYLVVSNKPPLRCVAPAAQRLRSCGVLYQRDIETLWDLVQKLLLDADVEVGGTAQHSTARRSRLALRMLV